MRKVIISFLVVLMIGCTSNKASASALIESSIPNAAIVGTGKLKFIFWPVYTITLHAPGGKWQDDKPFSLTLDYLRSISGEKIADRSAQEMRHIGLKDEVKIATWHTQMRDIFPDVKKGTKLTGIYQPNKPTYFFQDQTLIGTVTDPEFGKWFFNIWLSEKTSQPKLRQQLLGR